MLQTSYNKLLHVYFSSAVFVFNLKLNILFCFQLVQVNTTIMTYAKFSFIQHSRQKFLFDLHNQGEQNKITIV